jgi:ferredoxin-NADP reductase
VPLTFAIRDVLPSTPRARIVHLDLAGSAFPYLAGQAVVVGAPGGPKRPYSLASSPDDARREGHIELLVGVDAAGRPGPHLVLEAGRLVEVEGPLGSFTFPRHPDERRFVFIAGGTGIAPLRAMIHEAVVLPHAKIGLFYSARTPDEFAYEAEFQEMARAGRIELRETVTRDVERAWDGPRGRIDRALLAPLVHDPATLCFVCGPPPLVTEMSHLLAELGIDEARIRVEKWG